VVHDFGRDPPMIAPVFLVLLLCPAFYPIEARLVDLSCHVKFESESVEICWTSARDSVLQSKLVASVTGHDVLAAGVSICWSSHGDLLPVPCGSTVNVRCYSVRGFIFTSAS